MADFLGWQPVFLEWQEAGYNLGPSEPTEKLAFYYAVTSIAYYEKDASLIPDGIYDLLCKELLERPDIPSWLDKESLAAGTGYDSTGFPFGVYTVAMAMLDYQHKLDDCFNE